MRSGGALPGPGRATGALSVDRPRRACRGLPGPAQRRLGRSVVPRPGLPEKGARGRGGVRRRRGARARTPGLPSPFAPASRRGTHRCRRGHQRRRRARRSRPRRASRSGASHRAAQALHLRVRMPGGDRPRPAHRVPERRRLSTGRSRFHQQRGPSAGSRSGLRGHRGRALDIRGRSSGLRSRSGFPPSRRSR